MKKVLDFFQQSQENYLLYVTCDEEGIYIYKDLDLDQPKIQQHIDNQSQFLNFKLPNLIISTALNKPIEIFELQNGIYNLKQSISNEITGAEQFEVSPDGKFIFLAQGVAGITVADLMNGKIVTNKGMESDYGARWVVLHPQKKIYIIMTRWGDTYISNYDYYYQENLPIEFQPLKVIPDPSASLKQDMWISTDGNQLFQSHVGKGIVIFDISDPVNSKIFQIIEILGNLQYHNLEPISNSVIYVMCTDSLKIYKTKNVDFVEFNMFTRYQSEFIESNNDEKWPWIPTRDNNILYLPYGGKGLIIYDITNLPKLKEITIIDDSKIENFRSPFSVKISKVQQNRIFVGCYTEWAFFVLDVEDYLNPKLISSLFIENDSILSLESFNNTEHYIIASTINAIMILDIKDQSNPKIHHIMEDKFNVFVGGGEKLVDLTFSQKYLFSQEAASGIAFRAEIKPDYTIDFKSYIDFNFPYQSKSSKRYGENIVYILGQTGQFGIYQIDEQEKWKQISMTKFVGKCYHMQYSNDENLMFISSTIRNRLMTYNISDLGQPQLIQVYRGVTEAFHIITLLQLNLEKKFLLVCTFTGIRIITLQVDSKLKSEFFIKSNTTGLQEITKKDDQQEIKVKIGEKIRIAFQVLENPEKKQIGEIFYYNPQFPEQLFDKYDNIQFDVQQKQLEIQVSKEFDGINTIIVGVNNFISTEDIIQELQDVDQGNRTALATELYEMAELFGYINTEGYPTDKVNINEAMVLLSPTLKQYYVNRLQKLLLQKIQLIPVYFDAQASLEFYINKASADVSPIIETFAEQLDIAFEIIDNCGAFFPQEFKGVVASYQNEQNLHIQGFKNAVNQSLKLMKIELFGNIQCQISTKISDGLNIDYFIVEDYKRYKFLQLNKHVKLNLKIQDQFNKNNPESKVYIQEEFSFEFSPDTFKDDDDLSYKLYLKTSSDEYLLITQQYSFNGCWVNFISNQKQIKGLCEQSQFGTKLKFKIVATDGFSSVEDYMSVHFLKIPTLTILYYLAVGMSGFLTVIGIIQKRGILYGICCKSQYRNGNYYITENQEFLIQIIISKDEMRVGQNHFQLFLKQMKQNKIDLKSVLFDENMEKFKFNRKKIIELYNQFVPEFQSQSFQSENSFPYTIFKALYCHHIIKQFSKEYFMLKKLKQYARQNSDLHKDRWYEFYVQITPVYVEDWYNFTPKISYQLDTIFQVLGMFQKDGKQQKNALKMSQKDVNRQAQDNNASKVEFIEDLHDLEDKQLSYPKLNLPFLFQLLKFATVGLDKVTYFQIKYTQGQCITQNNQKIKIARALRKRKSPFNCFLSMINMDYLDIPFNQNQPLPSWCEYKFHHNVIEIFGKLPRNVSEKEKKKDYIIRIDDINGFTMREFHLKQVDDISHCTPQLLVSKMTKPAQRQSKDGTYQIMKEIRQNQIINQQQIELDKEQMKINQSPQFNFSNILYTQGNSFMGSKSGTARQLQQSPLDYDMEFQDMDGSNVQDEFTKDKTTDRSAENSMFGAGSFIKQVSSMRKKQQSEKI